jgi:large subunit ribosomal protein L20
MVRVKKGQAALKHRKHLLKYTKGFKWGRKSKFRQAKEAMLHAWTHAYTDRKKKKRTFRALWQTQINAACKQNGITYSKFIHFLKLKNIQLDRRVLSEIAQKNPEIFQKIIKTAVE